jgi:hypothetical protein
LRTRLELVVAREDHCLLVGLAALVVALFFNLEMEKSRQDDGFEGGFSVT